MGVVMESCQDHDCSRRASCRRYNINADGYGNFKEWNKECHFYLPCEDSMNDRERFKEKLELAEQHREELREMLGEITGWGR